MKKQYQPKLDPKVDLAGATPEALVRALFRRVEPPEPAKPAVGNPTPEFTRRAESHAARQEKHHD